MHFFSAMTNCSSSTDKISRDIKSFLIASRNDLRINEQDIDTICRNRFFLAELLRRHSLHATPDLITHLFLLLNFLTKSSSSMIYASMKSHYSDSTIQTLLKVADGKAIKTLQRKTSSCATNDAFCERINEVCFSLGRNTKRKASEILI